VTVVRYQGTTLAMDCTTAREILAVAAARLAEAGVDSPRLDARLLLAHSLGVSPDAVLVTAGIDAERLDVFEALTARRCAREPLSYIVGTREFFSLDFEVGRGVLIPRPETETLIEQAMREFPDSNAPLAALDLGTGSACLIVAFLVHYRNAQGTGIDASPDALAWAKRNIDRHGLSGRCKLLKSKWNADGAFDVVFANPPYLTKEEFANSGPEIRGFEPVAALVAGCDGLSAYRAMIPQVARLLKARGRVFLEVGTGQSAAVGEILRQNGLDLLSVVPDLAGIARCLVAGRSR